MLSKLRAELQAFEEAEARQRSLREDLARAYQVLQSEQPQVAAYRTEVRRRESSVSALEGGLKGLMASLTGSKAEQLARERQAYEVARRQLEHLEASTAAAERHIAFLQQELSQIGALEGQRAKLMERIEAALVDSDLPQAEQLAQTRAWLEKVRATADRIGSCVELGERAQIELTGMLSSLKGARRMGMLDMAGGGLVISMIKHSRIDSANQASREVGDLLADFSDLMTELQEEFEERFSHIDLSSARVGELQMGSMLKAADMFLDGIIFDWTAQGKIKSSQLEAETARDKVTEALNALQTMLIEVQAQAGKLIEQRDRLIHEALSNRSGQAAGELLPLEPVDVDDEDTREATQVDPIRPDIYDDAPTDG